jgi:hypothetical protein
MRFSHSWIHLRGLTVYQQEEVTPSVNSFRPRKYEDFHIVDDQNRVVGHIRVKPSGVLWAPADAGLWYGVKLSEFAKYMEENGERQEKRAHGWRRAKLRDHGRCDAFGPQPFTLSQPV